MIRPDLRKEHLGLKAVRSDFLNEVASDSVDVGLTFNDLKLYLVNF